MILVTRFNGSQFYVNAEMVMFVESTPDTVITLVNNGKVLVKEQASSVVEQIVEYQRKVRASRGAEAFAEQRPGA